MFVNELDSCGVFCRNRICLDNLFDRETIHRGAVAMERNGNDVLVAAIYHIPFDT